MKDYLNSLEEAKNGQYSKSKRRGNDESPYRVPKGRDHGKGAPIFKMQYSQI